MPRLGHYRFSETDVAKTFSNLGMWWDHLTTGIDATAAHIHGSLLSQFLADVLGADVLGADVLGADVLGADVLGADVLGADDLGQRLTDLGRAAAARFAGNESSAEAVAALGLLWHAMRDAMESLRRAGVVSTSGQGTVARINVSGGGVPKSAVDRVEVSLGGIVGDRQRSRQHHGRPWQALCLWSVEVIDAFARDGHPIAPGAAGENLTLSGIDWLTVRPGVLLRVGTVLAEASAWAIPCRHNAQWFTDGDFNRMSHVRGPVARVYATVIETGSINTGDAVRIVAQV